jgi:hypothetical protein
VRGWSSAAAARKHVMVLLMGCSTLVLCAALLLLVPCCCICCICISAQSGHVYSHHVQIYSHTHSNQLEGGPGGVILDSTATGSIRTATSGLCRHHHAIRTFLLGITDLSVHYAHSRTILSTDVAQPRQGVRACSGN